MVLLASCIFLSNIGCLVAVGEADLGLEENKKGNRASDKCKWGYGLDDGPDTWPKNCSPYCNGTSQSPINIEPKNAVEEDVGMIKLFYYDKMIWGNLQNNGKTLGFTPHSPNPYYWNPEGPESILPPDYPPLPPYIEGGRLPKGERFEFHSFHWHWGSDPSKGSEHTINGKSYPLALHLVHVNMKYKDDLNKALSKKDGLAVLGVLYELVKEDDHTPSETTLDMLLKYWKNHDREGCNKPARTNAFKLRDMLPLDLWKYYYYNGSLTTPTCNEAVLWTVFPHTLNVTQANLDEFNSAIVNCSSPFIRPLTNNYRPPQPLNGRKVYTNKVPDCCVRKTVGSIDYVVEGVSDGKSDPKCMNNCIFTPVDKVAGPKNCFMAGSQPVESCEKPKP